MNNEEQDPMGQNPGPQEEGMPEGGINIWQKFRRVVLNLWGSYIPLRN